MEVQRLREASASGGCAASKLVRVKGSEEAIRKEEEEADVE